MKTGAALSLVAIVGLVAACGPVESTVVIADADDAVNAARIAGAEEAAPYEFTTAELYLDKAREEQGYADFQTAIEYARTARTEARDAYRKAREALREGAGAAARPGGTGSGDTRTGSGGSGEPGGDEDAPEDDILLSP